MTHDIFCPKCGHPWDAHSEAWGCAVYADVEIPPGSGLIEQAPCGCFGGPTEEVEHARRDSVNKLVDELGITRFKANEILDKANAEGYRA